MVYITLDELKEILPDIFNQWMENDDNWEWIFQEIEQKCHISTKCKGKKWKKKLKSMVDTHSTVLSAHRNDINELNKKVDQLNKEVEEMHRKHIDESNSMSREIARIHSDIRSVKSMAQTAKQRTEVDYTKCSKEKSDADVVQDVYNRMVGRGATRDELDTFRNLIQKYDALEKKKIVVGEYCETCKHNDGRVAFDKPPCNSCNFNENWEAKDNA